MRKLVSEGRGEDFARAELEEDDLEILEAIEAYERKHGPGSFHFDHASAKKTFYGGPIPGRWPDEEQLQPIRSGRTENAPGRCEPGRASIDLLAPTVINCKPRRFDEVQCGEIFILQPGVLYMDEKPADVLTIEELSAYLKIPKSTLYKLVREGKVPSQKIGRHWRFRKVAIDRWLEDTEG